MEGARTPQEPLRFAVLGPVLAWRGREALDTGSPQQRALLAALLLRGGRTATVGELIDGLWDGNSPPTALNVLRTYAFRIRRSFGTEGAGLLVSDSGGYAIRTAPDGSGPALELDLDRARSLAEEGQEARRSGDPVRARGLLAEALGVWQGESLAGLPGPYAETQRTRLEEWRLSLTEARLDLDLEVGSHAEAVSELTALTAAHPLRERLRELLMLALYRSGRQAEALAVYADTRRLLADELGVDPRPELAELQQRILNADAGLAVAAGPARKQAGFPEGFIRPAQLPADIAHFTGRSAHVTEIRELLAAGRGSSPAVPVVTGTGGVGKTTLAVHVAHCVRHHFPDGQLYADLQGAGPEPAEPEAVLGWFLRALGVSGAAVPDGLDERAALFRSTLDGRRVLVLLDNARDAAQIRPLLPGTGGCAALVTSRHRMTGLAGARIVDLDVMDPGEGLALFTRIVGSERASAEPGPATGVVAACGFLPLAIRIAASRLAGRRTWTVSVLARKLGDERRRLDELRAGDLAVKATFELGYGQLEPGQARAFRLLGLADGPDISLAAAAAVLDLDIDATEELLESLVDTSLLECAAPGRYRYHDLVRLYARACAERDEQPAGREAALSRLLDFYLATAARAYALERPGDRLVAHLAPTEAAGLALKDGGEAVDWLATEAACILSAVRLQARGDSLRRAADLLLVAKDLVEAGISGNTYIHTAQIVLAAAQAAGDAQSEGRACIVLAHAHRLTGQMEEADAYARRSVLLGDTTEDPLLIRCYAANQLGIVAIYQRRYREAEAHLGRALEYFRADGNRIGEASALANLSRVHGDLGDAARAVELAEAALAIYRGAAGSWRLGNGLYALGLALAEAGRPDEGLDRLEEALAIFRDSRQRWWEGVTLYRMAEVHVVALRPAEAVRSAELALSVLRGLGTWWQLANALTVLARALDLIGQAERARACRREADAVRDRQGAAERTRAAPDSGARPGITFV
ncbi:AfsR/SARP family transcriptional regulator [Streptomyces hiroshimensis]|uniref:Regulatory protein AfsR n=1 Tax=Streptomyces hiroshimensis TaxID=66424 RepID=A0ABQ2YYD0_9ACTN|nr:regulatory protein AfsR [Streptomyces hiroshimensis]